MIGRRGLDVDIVLREGQTLVGGVEQVAGRRRQRVSTQHVSLCRGERASEADQRIRGEQVPQAVEAGAPRDEIVAHAIDGGLVDVESRSLDPRRHRLELRAERARVIDGREIASYGEDARDHDDREDRYGAQRDGTSQAATPRPWLPRLRGIDHRVRCSADGRRISLQRR